MVDGLVAPKMPPQMNMSRSSTPWLCVIGGETCEASEVGKRFVAVQSNLTDILGMSRFSARCVPRMLTNDQKKSPLYISRHLLSCYEDDPGDFIERVITQDETWVHHFDTE